MLRINEIKVPLGAGEYEIKKAAARLVGVRAEDFLTFEIVRESIDSRKKDNIFMVYSADVRLDAAEESIASRFERSKVFYHEAYKYELPEIRRNSEFRPVIAGFGPAGMFCALWLARQGFRPIVLERGHDVDARTRDVETFWRERRLCEESNVQFGEGGAGTFSDGKLTTGIKDGRIREVIRTLVEFGAPEEIAYSARPHIGTDKLCGVVKNLREAVIALGGEVRFGCRLTDIYVANEFLQGVSYTDEAGGVHDIETDCLVLCTGHSARDTVEMLYKKGVKMEQKAFSVGTRIEHPQEMINRSQYGKFYNDPRLGAADYKLWNHPPHGRGGYTFCMCPGGTVVCASSEENTVVTNGMSNHARDGENANSAILIGIEPDHFEDDSPLAGFAFQRELERKAFAAGGGDYTAPCQLVGDFLAGRKTVHTGKVRATCPTGVTGSDMRLVLPKVVTDGIGKAIEAFDRKLRGFAMSDAVLTFPESRSSSPVRILRDEFFQTNIHGLYPCGEGAGYAGGIVSAAVDGIRCAEHVFEDETDF